MKKQKPKELLERLPFPNLRPVSLLVSTMSEEERILHEAEVKVHNDAIMEEIHELTCYKLFLLLKYHGIDLYDEHRWFILATKLAQQYEPGFQIQTAPSGRVNKWEFTKLLGLLTLVEMIRENKPGASISQVCHLILNNYLPDLKVSKKTIENRYLEAKNDLEISKWYSAALRIDQRKGGTRARNEILKEAFQFEI